MGYIIECGGVGFILFLDNIGGIIMAKKDRKFDTNVQHLKYLVLKAVSYHAFEDSLAEAVIEIPKIISPGPEPTMRCCIYKERAIVTERIKLAMGFSKNENSVIEVLEIACDECSASGYEIRDLCRGCLAHPCVDNCPKGAITINENQRGHGGHQLSQIDK
jgi:ferredoxin